MSGNTEFIESYYFYFNTFSIFLIRRKHYEKFSWFDLKVIGSHMGEW